jgi:1-deoxyxylulose-5-phosphate synthase
MLKRGIEGLDAWALNEEEAQDHHRRVFEVGFAFDTADSYSSGLSEEIHGRPVKRLAAGGTRSPSPPKSFFATGPDAKSKRACRVSISDMPSTIACAPIGKSG